MEQCLNYFLKNLEQNAGSYIHTTPVYKHTTYHSHHDSMIMNSHMDEAARKPITMAETS
jgi:hypothetical protein